MGEPAFTEKLKVREKLGFGAYSMSVNVVYQFKGIYYFSFLTMVIKMNVLYAGLILTIGTIWDAINDPLVGYWAVNFKAKSGEKVRPFILWTAIPWAFFIVMMFVDWPFPEMVTVVACIIVYIIFELLDTVVGIPYYAQASVSTNRDSDRRAINVYRMVGNSLGTGVGAAAVTALVGIFGGLDKAGNPNEGAPQAFIITAVIMGIVGIAGSLFHYYTTKERVKPTIEEEVKLSVKTVCKAMFGCRSWVMNVLYVIGYGVVTMLVMNATGYYSYYVLGHYELVKWFQLLYLGVGIVTSMLVIPIDKLLGRKKTMMLGALVFMAGSILFLINPLEIAHAYINTIGCAAGLSIAYVMTNTNRNNICDIIEWQSGHRVDSLASTADNFAGKLAVAVATQLLSISLASAGFNANLGLEQPESVTGAIIAMLGWAPLCCAVFMLIIAIFHSVEHDQKKMFAEKAAKVQDA